MLSVSRLPENNIPGRPGIREAPSQANTRRPGAAGDSRGLRPLSSRGHATGGGRVFARRKAKRIPEGREPQGIIGG